VQISEQTAVFFPLVLQQLIGLYDRAGVFTVRYGLDLYVKFRSVFNSSISVG